MRAKRDIFQAPGRVGRRSGPAGGAAVLLAALFLAGCQSGRVAGPPPAATPPPPSPVFLVGAGDDLSVRIWRNDDLNRQVRVDPSGLISLPLIGDVKAEGRTPPELAAEIRTRYAEKFLVNPQVDVNVAQVRSRKVYVLGEVRSPGSFDLDPRMLPWEAVARAGGFTEDANRQAIMLVRRNDGKGEALVLNLAAMLEGTEMPSDALLRDRDVLYIPPARIASVERFMIRLNNILSPILSLESGIILGREASDALKGTERVKDVVVTR